METITVSPFLAAWRRVLAEPVLDPRVPWHSVLVYQGQPLQLADLHFLRSIGVRTVNVLPRS